MILILIIVAALAVVLIGAIYWYSQRQPVSLSDQPQTQEDLNQELNSLEVGDLEKDFADVDKDVESL